MSDGWQSILLGDVASGVRGISYRSAELSEERKGQPFINLKCVGRGGGFQPEGVKWFTGTPKPTQVVTGGSLLIAVTDLTRQREVVGSPILVPHLIEDRESATFSLDLLRLVVDESRASVLYLNYALSSPRVRSYMQHASSGTTVMHLSMKEALKCPIMLPSLDEQYRIVALLESSRLLIEGYERTLAAAQGVHSSLVQDLVDGTHRIPVSDAEVEG